MADFQQPNTQYLLNRYVSIWIVEITLGSMVESLSARILFHSVQK